MNAPLSFAQQRLWFLDELHPGATGYNIPSAHRVRGPLDPGLLADALTEVVRRHEVVRSVVADGPGGQPVLQARPPEPVKLPVTLVGGTTPDRRLANAAELARAHVLRPFDLRHGPLLRADLFRLGDDDHVLLLCLHHLVADQWTLSLLLRELSELYPSFLLGFGSPRPEPVVQYADFTRWQRETLTDEVLAPQLRHWRERLAGFEQLELLTDHPRPPVQCWDGARVRRRIPAEVLAGVRELAAKHDVTLFAAVAAGLSALLARHTGQGEVVFGAAIAHRDRPEFEDLLGFFVNTVVLRTDLSGNPDFGELLARVQETALQAQENQDLPIERLADLAGPDRNLSRPPLVNVVLSFLNTPADPLRIPGSAVSEFVFDPGVVKFELDFMVFESGGELVVDVDYRRDLFERATVERLLLHLERILAGAAADPARPVAALAVLSPDEEARLLLWGNASEPPVTPSKTVPELFAEQVARRPDAPAVRSGAEVLTYAELDVRAGQVADAVRAHTDGPLCVGVCLDRSIDQVAALLGILQAGGHYLPLDPGYPAERLEYLLGDAGAAVVVTSAAFADRTAGWDGPKVLVENVTAAPASRPAAAIGPEDLAYVMYTSGSTGRPKGVRVPHRAVVRLVHETDYVRIGPGDRVAHSSSISFDAATFEIWGALLTGAELVVLPRETVVEPPALARELREQGVTVLWMTSSLFNHTVGDVPDAVAGIGTVLVGGEALDPAVIRAVLAGGNAPRRLLNGYGPTENTTFSTTHLITAVPDGAVSVPIGRPIRGTRCYVTDAELRLVPAGVPGELCVAGLGLAHGYVGVAERTAGRFVADPHGAPGDLLYRTGDVVRWRPDGTLEFLGRRDDQVKVRGYRVEPGEIEARLTACPGVRAALVLVRPSEGGGKLVAYVVADGSPAELSTEDIQARLAGTLPGHMVPSDILALDQFPLNANGKVDRARLPEPERAGRATGFVAPRTELETTVCRVWAQLLGVAEVGVTGNFFHLGGTSLLATRVVGRLRRELGVRVSVRTLFDHPTAGDFAAAVRETKGTRA
ncbi:MAG: hypothetical protein QOI78_202 [Actinomycetota bacterium]|nr:hypothetical protein [Actinomycetota bacterium]